MTKEMSQKEQRLVLNYFKTIRNAAIFIKDYFHNKTLHYKSETHNFSLKILNTNLMHLCGLQYDSGAKAFFKDAVDNKLRIVKIKIKTDNTTLLKLQVLSELVKLTTSEITLCPASVLGEVRYHFAIRTNKKILMVALNSTESDYLVPISLINLTTMKHDPKGEKVKSIFVEDHICKTTTRII